MLELLPKPYRTIVVVAQCLGLRVSEILALEWEDVDFEKLSLFVRRSVVHGRVDEVKTGYPEGGFHSILILQPSCLPVNVSARKLRKDGSSKAR